MKKNRLTQFFAILALAWIIIWVFGTWILFFTGGNSNTQSKKITQEELQKLIKEKKIQIETNTWSNIKIITWTWTSK